jgi:hypothetical protein
VGVLVINVWVFSNMYTVLCLRFFLPWLRFSVFPLSCKAHARVKLTKTGHVPRSSTLVICVVRLLFVLFYVLFVCKCVLPPGDNPTAVNKYIISYSTGLFRNVRTTHHTQHHILEDLYRQLAHKTPGFLSTLKIADFNAAMRFNLGI